MANYLSASGYRFDQPWGTEVIAPQGFDWSMADGNDRRLSTWKAQGLTPIRGGSFGASDSDYAQLWLPAGATGPKYLLFRNFEVFKTYNRSNSYAFAVGLLADGLGGQYGPVAAWELLRSPRYAGVRKHDLWLFDNYPHSCAATSATPYPSEPTFLGDGGYEPIWTIALMNKTDAVSSSLFVSLQNIRNSSRDHEMAAL